MEKMRRTIITIMIGMVIGLNEICECCFESERNGLLQIKSSFNPRYSPNYISSWGTSGADCCAWQSVYCNPTTGHVTALYLPGNITNVDLGHFWYLNASLFLPFQQLHVLYLPDNSIAGCIHNEGFERLSELTNLESLYLSSNKFNSSILQSFGGLHSLKFLDLSQNQLNGKIDITELNNLASTLQVLDLSDNQIEGFENVTVKFNRLENLQLSYNAFNSSILPFLKELPYLKTLHLEYNNIKGPFDFKDVNGLINVEEMYLSNNQITNFVILPIGLDKLEVLDLSHNQFNHTTNDFLQTIGRMSSLQTLRLRESRLTGNIPENSQGLCHLNHLVDLDMSYNDLIGNLPECLANLTSLQHLDVQQNDLNGNLPSGFANFTSLQTLNLCGNQLSGNISSSPLRSLTSLQSLDISQNLFQIPISLSPLFNLSQLKFLTIGDNTVYEDTEDYNSNPKFQLVILSLLYGYGKGGALPKFLYHQHELQSVVIFSIELRGGFPNWLLENNTRLSLLFFSNTSLSGPIKLPNHPHMNLVFLDISDNFFSGSIPSQIGDFFPSLGTLSMPNNELKGSIPNSLCEKTPLSFLDISHNNVLGTIPNCIGNMSQIRVLDLSNNNFSGSLPSNFSPPSLLVVNLSKNRLQGLLRDSFLASSQLVVLDLSHNNLSGNILPGIQKLSNLSFLVLGYNNFQGAIPIALCELKQLSFLDLSNNNIHGHMLPCLNITSSWSMEKYVDNLIAQPLELTTKGRTYPYEKKVLNYISGVDISCNSLTGQIPLEIENLRNIKVLNLSHNTLIGKIPTTLSNLKQIESLDLSCNNLQGSIPPQLTQLTSLSSFNVSYNNLSGQTPNQMAQFATFDETSYRGNPFLCGWPLPKSCSEVDIVPLIEGSDNEIIDMEFFYVSFGVTYVIMLLALVIVLRINLYWRTVWFYYIQMIVDKTYYFIVDN